MKNQIKTLLVAGVVALAALPAAAKPCMIKITDSHIINADQLQRMTRVVKAGIEYSFFTGGQSVSYAEVTVLYPSLASRDQAFEEMMHRINTECK